VVDDGVARLLSVVVDGVARLLSVVDCLVRYVAGRRCAEVVVGCCTVRHVRSGWQERQKVDLGGSEANFINGQDSTYSAWLTFGPGCQAVTILRLIKL